MKIFFKNKIIRRIHSNKLKCNCKLTWLSKWLQEHQSLAHQTKCIDSQKTETEILKLKTDIFTCKLNEDADTCDVETSCPLSCTCDMNVVDCKEKSLAMIPGVIREATTELYF